MSELWLAHINMWSVFVTRTKKLLFRNESRPLPGNFVELSDSRREGDQHIPDVHHCSSLIGHLAPMTPPHWTSPSLTRPHQTLWCGVSPWCCKVCFVDNHCHSHTWMLHRKDSEVMWSNSINYSPPFWTLYVRFILPIMCDLLSPGVFRITLHKQVIGGCFMLKLARRQDPNLVLISFQ